MKVEVLSGASRSEGGLFYSVRWLSQSLLVAGVEIQLTSHIDEFTDQDVSFWSPVRVELYPTFGPLLSSPKLRTILKKTQPDLLHVHGIWLDRQWAALQWQKRTGNPVVISPRGMLDPWAIQNAAWKKKLVGKIFANESLRKATCIHALCQSEVESIRAYNVKTPIAMIPNGVELPREKSVEKAEGKKKLLFLGRIHPKKGLVELISGWAQAKLRDWELLIAGWDDGGHESALKSLAADIGVSETVKFMGPVFGDDKEILLRGVDGFILPSFSEGLPMSVLEAWSYRLPVLMTRYCNLPAGFSSNAALKIEPNAEAVSCGLIKLAAMNTIELETMGFNGRKLVEERYTWKHIATEMKSVYEWCLGGDKPACIQEL